MEERVEDYIKRIEIIIETLSDHIEFENYDEDVLKEASKDKEALKKLLKDYKELKEENKNARNEIIKIINTPEAIKNSINELKTNQFIGENVKLVILNYIDKITTDNEDLKNDLYQDGLSHKYLTLKATSIPTSVIQKKIEEVNNSNGYSPVNKIFIEKVLNEILEEGRR